MIFSHYHSTRARRELNAFQSLKSNLGFFKHSNQICVPLPLRPGFEHFNGLEGEVANSVPKRNDSFADKRCLTSSFK